MSTTLNSRKKLIAAAALAMAGAAQAQVAGGIVITQFAVRGPAGGNDEFVEIQNTGGAAVAIGGWTLQGCANGAPGNASIRATVPAGTVLGAGQYYLFANTAASGYSLGVAPDATYATGFTDFSATGYAGIRLVAGNATAAGSPFVDAVGGGLSPCREGSGIVTPTATGPNTAFLRRLLAGAVQDGNDNATDFPGPAAPGAPRNSATVAGGGDSPRVSLSLSPVSFGENGGSALLTATLSAPAATAVSIDLVLSGSATIGADYSVAGTTLVIPAGASSAVLTISALDDGSFEGDETIRIALGAITGAVAGLPDSVTATVLDDEPAPPPTIGARIAQIQGARHRSPMTGLAVSNVPGIVTARASNGFYLQDPDGDGDDATSEGLFVFTSSAPPAAAAVGAQVLVSGTVQEFRPGNDATNLTVTQIGAPTVVAYSGGSLFARTTVTPTVIGQGGRRPPSEIIDDDSNGNVETSATHQFDPAQDGLDFLESLEGMVVRLDDTRATGPRNSFGEVWVLGDGGAGASGVNARGGITLVPRATGIDFNPERIQLDDGLNGVTMPAGINTGDRLGDVTGIASYAFGNYEVLLTAVPTVTAQPLPPGVRSIEVGGDRLSVGAYNVENLDPSDSTFAAFGRQIVEAMGAPDLLALSEIQDNSGATNDGTVAADRTLALLIEAIVAAGGPRYQAVSVDPVDNQDGGQPGGNIRVVQLWNPERLRFVPGTAGSGGATDATAPTLVDGRIALSLSPGRIAPTDSAWNASRKPLAATYDFNGRRLVVVNNHFNSKGGDQPLQGVNQPPARGSETQRLQQAEQVRRFVDAVQALDGRARVIVLGDLNDFPFSPPLATLTGGVPQALHNLGTDLVADPVERYSYVFEGNSQELDHILVSDALRQSTAEPRFEVIRLNAEYASALSDHEPLLASFRLPANQPPLPVVEPLPLSFEAGDTVTLDGSGSSDRDGRIVSYRWTQLSGPPVTLAAPDQASTTFVAPSVAEHSVLTFRLTVTDDEGESSEIEPFVRVVPAPDTTPLPFSFEPRGNVPLAGEVESNTVIVLGINRPAAISVTGGEFSINGGAYSAMLGAVVNDGDRVRVRLVSAATPLTTTRATLTIDTVSAAFQVTTEAADTQPEPYGYGSADGVRLNSLQVSAPVTVRGINVATPIVVDGGDYAVNGGAWTTAPGTVRDGDRVQVRGRAARRVNATTTVSTSIGGVVGSYAITTRRLLERPAD